MLTSVFLVASLAVLMHGPALCSNHGDRYTSPEPHRYRWSTLSSKGNYECPDDNTKWGPNCDKDCPLGCGRTSWDDRICYSDGECRMGCSQGWLDEEGNCKACPKGYYKRIKLWGMIVCYEKCPYSCRHGVCHPDDGTCMFCNNGKMPPTCKFCMNGTMPPSCEKPCEQGKWGVNCKENCPWGCRETCEPVSGKCLPCLNNTKWGPLCDKNCSLGCYRFRDDPIQCNREGKCLSPMGCANGWEENGECKACPRGLSMSSSSRFTPRFSPRGLRKVEQKRNGVCNKTCPENCRHGVCDTAGYCGDCTDGYVGHLCNLPCKPGAFGYRCYKKCPAPCSKLCDRVTGSCTCPDQNYWGPNCNLPCLSGCKCLIDGTCVEECADKGYNSDESKCQACPDGKYGTHDSLVQNDMACEFDCHEHCKPGECQRESDVCNECVEPFYKNRFYCKDNRYG